MMSKLANYLQGAVRIRVSGMMPEKLINLCVTQNISLWGITKHNDDLLVWMKLGDFFTIREMVRKSRTRITIVRRYGFPFTAKRFKRRKVLLIGPLIFFLALNILSSYVWFVDVMGLKNLSDSRIKEIAFQQGLKPGVLKSNINTKQIENEILIILPEVAWIGVNFVGTRAVIEIVEKTVPKQEDKSPANLIAAKDGVITEIIVLAGQTMLKKGDTVKKGDLLIQGIVPQAPEAPEATAKPPAAPVPEQPIRAKGIVKARVWYESYGETELATAVHEPTGRQQLGVVLKIGSNEFVVKQPDLTQFALYEQEARHKKLPLWRNSGLIVESSIDVYHELDTRWLEITLEQARDAAKTKALDQLQRLIPQTAHILSRNVEVIKTAEANLVRVKVTIEAEEDIVQSVMITQ